MLNELIKIVGKIVVVPSVNTHCTSSSRGATAKGASCRAVSQIVDTEEQDVARKFKLEMTKGEHRKWLAEACAKFVQNGGKITVVPRGQSGLHGGISSKMWYEFMQQPGKVDVKKIEVDRERQHLLDQLVRLEKELRAAEHAARK